MTGTVTQALLSVSDKSGILELARGLVARDVKLLSTGGTAKLLAAAGVPVTDIGTYTGFPEMLDGRVKTLHPKVHGGILARRELKSHRDALAEAEIAPIDLVVVNLYPFRETVANPQCTLDDAIENIDIGGPAMLRAAAKNWAHVGAVVDPADYGDVLAELTANGGALSAALRFRLMQRAFAHTAAYDGAIANWVSALAAYRQLQGKEMSYNNVADADAAWQCVTTFADPTCVIVKHANPCGVATAGGPLDSSG